MSAAFSPPRPPSLREGGAIAAMVVLVACGDTAITPEGGSNQGAAPVGGSTAVTGGQSGGVGGASGGSGPQGGSPPCPAGLTCVTQFPFTDSRDTAAEGTDTIDSYDCSPDTNEAGREIVYRVTVPQAGFLSAAAYVEDGVDIDVHILTSFDPAAPAGTSCVSRGDRHAKADVSAGDVWVIADTWTNAGGTSLEGAFKIDIGFVPVASGPCEMDTGEMPRVGDGGDHLAMPATGPVVMEAHLVTQAEPKPYPSTNSEELLEHYALSQADTGLVMFREQLWAPMEGGSFFGAGIGSPQRFPLAHEGWYVNMYWTPAARPPRGTKMILRLPDDPSRAVVVAAGYETGPGNLSNVAGTPEETHFYLGTEHLGEMTIGIATDQSLPFGPRLCN
jgi:hypothetical protein